MGGDGDRALPRLRRGCRCFAGLVGGEVVVYGWVSSGPEWIGELGVEIRPAPGEVYVWNCVTLPAHRAHGCFRALLTHIVGAVPAQRLWIGSVDEVAERAIAAAGFEPVVRLGTGGRRPRRRRH